MQSRSIMREEATLEGLVVEEPGVITDRVRKIPLP
jgi:hypothetical protein